MDYSPEPDRSGPMFSSRRRRARGGRRALPLVAYAILLVVAGVFGWLWQSSRGSGAGGVPGPTDAQAATPDTAGLTAIERTPGVPALDTSDTFVRNLAARVSAHPQFATWLVTDNLARRFVITVVEIAHGRSPQSHLRFMAPVEGFRARTEDGRFVLDPAGYRRYNTIAETFVSLDTEGTAEAFERLSPLFERAYRELGLPDQTLRETLRLAFQRMIEAEIPQGPLELRPDGAVYGFTRPELERLTEAEKHLIRMGPENARRLQEKLRDLAEEMDMLPAAKPGEPGVAARRPMSEIGAPR